MDEERYKHLEISKIIFQYNTLWTASTRLANELLIVAQAANEI